jgi:hypothetical protein
VRCRTDVRLAARYRSGETSDIDEAGGPMRKRLGSELEPGASRTGVVGAVALACVAAVAAIAWFLPRGATAGAAEGAGSAGPRVAAVAPASIRGSDRPAEAAARTALPAEGAGRARGKSVCAECGIIEAVQRVDTPLKFTGWCDAAEIARTQSSGRAYGRDFRADRESLSETVAAAIATSRASTKDAVTTQHRIVVRMRNGSRRIFDESTPRMVNVGDRMVVIAANG